VFKGQFESSKVNFHRGVLVFWSFMPKWPIRGLNVRKTPVIKVPLPGGPFLMSKMPLYLSHTADYQPVSQITYT